MDGTVLETASDERARVPLDGETTVDNSSEDAAAEQLVQSSPSAWLRLFDWIQGFALMFKREIEEEREKTGKRLNVVEIGGRRFALCDLTKMTGWQLEALFYVWDTKEVQASEIIKATKIDLRNLVQLLIKHKLLWEMMALIYVPIDEHERFVEDLSIKEYLENVTLMRRLNFVQITEGLTLFFVYSTSSLPDAIRLYFREAVESLLGNPRSSGDSAN